MTKFTNSGEESFGMMAVDLDFLSPSERSRLWLELEKRLRFDLITRIPSEVALRIFGLLDASSLCRAGQVSRDWRRLADDDILWHRLCRQHIERKCIKCGWMLPLMRYFAGSGNSFGNSGSSIGRTGRSNSLVSAMAAASVSESGGEAGADDSAATAATSMEVDCEGTPAKQQAQQSPPPSSTNQQLKKRWKLIYADRYLVENNWRKARYTCRLLSGHQQPVLCAQSTSQRLITGSADWTARVWDVPSGECLLILRGHRGPVRALQCDDSKIITGGEDGVVKIWNARTGECFLSSEVGNGSAITALSFCGTTLASGTIDGLINVYDCRVKQSARFPAHMDSITSLAFDRNSVGEVTYIPASTHTRSSTCTSTSAPKSCTTSSSSPSSEAVKATLPLHLFSASMDGLVKMWDWQSGTCLRTFSGHIGPVLDIKVFNYQPAAGFSRVFSTTASSTPLRPSSVLLSASQDGTIRLWDHSCGTLISSSSATTTTTTTTSFTANTNTAATTETTTFTNDRSSNLTDRLNQQHIQRRGVELDRWFGHVRGVTAINYNSHRLCSGGREGFLLLHSVQEGRLLHRISLDTILHMPTPPSITCIAMDDMRIFAGLTNTGDVAMIDFGIE